MKGTEDIFWDNRMFYVLFWVEVIQVRIISCQNSNKNHYKIEKKKPQKLKVQDFTICKCMYLK